MTEQWYAWLISSAYQTTLLFIIVGALELLAGRWLWPQLRLLLWSLVPLNLLVMPQWYFPWTIWQWVPVQSAQLTSAGTDSIPLMHFVLWLIGCVSFLLVLTLRLRRLKLRLLRQSKLLTNWPVYQHAAGIIGCKPPPLVVSKQLHSPLVIGVFRPVIVFPEATLKYGSTDDIQLALCHELGHIRRRDHWCAAVFIGLASLAWFNPLVWLAIKRVNQLREFCCDALVMRRLGGSGSAYRQMLMRAALNMQQAGQSSAGIQPAMGLLNGSPAIFKRIKYLRGRLLGQRHWARALCLIFVVGLSLTTLPPPPVLGAAILANPDTPGCLLTRYAVLANLHQQQSSD